MVPTTPSAGELEIDAGDGTTLVAMRRREGVEGDLAKLVEECGVEGVEVIERSRASGRDGEGAERGDGGVHWA